MKYQITEEQKYMLTQAAELEGSFIALKNMLEAAQYVDCYGKVNLSMFKSAATSLMESFNELLSEEMFLDAVAATRTAEEAQEYMTKLYTYNSVLRNIDESEDIAELENLL